MIERRETTSAKQTLALGAALGQALVGNLTIALVGPLGAGKTQLVKGIAAGNALDETPEVTSPTFTLVNEYAGRLKLYHLDAYRLTNANELIALGYDDFASPSSAVIVEWADKVRDVLPDDTLWIEITPTDQVNRMFTLRATGATSKDCLANLAR